MNIVSWLGVKSIYSADKSLGTIHLHATKILYSLIVSMPPKIRRKLKTLLGGKGVKYFYLQQPYYNFLLT